MKEKDSKHYRKNIKFVKELLKYFFFTYQL